MFTYYTYPLGKIIQSHNLKYHIYADDTHIYIEFDPKIPGDTVIALHKLQAVAAPGGGMGGQMPPQLEALPPHLPPQSEWDFFFFFTFLLFFFFFFLLMS